MAREQPVVARDFLGIGLTGDITKIDDVVGKQNLSHGVDRSMSVNGSPFLNHMAIAGMKHSMWSKAATMQRFLPPRGSFEERFKEQSAENLPQFAHQGLASNNSKNGLHAQAWWQGDSHVNAELPEEGGPSIPISGNFRGSATRTMISPSKPEAVVVNGVRASSEMRMPSSGITDIQHNAPLTIFYAGNVNVFNNISAEKAQEIMFLASGGNVQGSPVEPMSAAVTVKSMNGAATFSAHEKSPKNLQSCQTVVNQQAQASQADHLTTNMKLDFTHLNIVNQQAQASQADHLTTNMKLDFTHLNIPIPSSPFPTGQPVVPTALPHARKASLTRFFEKRRERVHSKGPYHVEREDSSLPEERLSSSNDSHALGGGEGPDRKRGLIPSWMQRVAECSTSNMAGEEQKITAN